MPQVFVEISARHIHLAEKDLFILFGNDYSLKKQKNLSQSGEFAAKEIITIVNGDKKLTFRVIGPLRKVTQVELSVSDCIFLKIKPSLKLSGDLFGSSKATLVGPSGQLKLKQGVIVAKRHLHIDFATAQKWKLKNGQKISVLTKGDRAVEFKNIIVRIGNFQTRLHLDTDEANAAGLKNNDKVYLQI